MDFTAGAPKRNRATGVLVWRGRWSRLRFPQVYIGILAVTNVANVIGVWARRTSTAPPWLESVIIGASVLVATGYVAGLAVYFVAPRLSWSVDFTNRRMSLRQDSWWFRRGTEQVISLDDVRGIKVVRTNEGVDRLSLETTQGEVRLPSLGHYFANHEALNHLRSVVSSS